VTSLQEALDAAADDPASPAWDLIWQESCHQGTCDPASAVLLPWLARTCANLSPQDRERGVVLAGFIAVDADDLSRGLYAGDIATLRALTEVPPGMWTPGYAAIWCSVVGVRVCS
jgi:hypothetical protein